MFDLIGSHSKKKKNIPLKIKASRYKNLSVMVSQCIDEIKSRVKVERLARVSWMMARVHRLERFCLLVDLSSPSPSPLLASQTKSKINMVSLFSVATVLHT